MRVRGSAATAERLDVGNVTEAGNGAFRRGLRLAPGGSGLRGPEKYRMLELQRRRAQIRARRALGLA